MEPRINFTKEWGRGSLGVGVWSTKEEIWLVLLFFGLKWVYWAVKPGMCELMIKKKLATKFYIFS